MLISKHKDQNPELQNATLVQSFGRTTLDVEPGYTCSSVGHCRHPRSRTRILTMCSVCEDAGLVEQWQHQSSLLDWSSAGRSSPSSVELSSEKTARGDSARGAAGGSSPGCGSGSIRGLARPSESELCVATSCVATSCVATRSSGRREPRPHPADPVGRSRSTAVRLPWPWLCPGAARDVPEIYYVPVSDDTAKGECSKPALRDLGRGAAAERCLPARATAARRPLAAPRCSCRVRLSPSRARALAREGTSTSPHHPWND